jgi:hypothetical protein
MALGIQISEIAKEDAKTRVDVEAEVTLLIDTGSKLRKSEALLLHPSDGEFQPLT